METQKETHKKPYKEPSVDQPPCCLFIGMAGSGKTTLMKVQSNGVF